MTKLAHTVFWLFISTVFIQRTFADVPPLPEPVSNNAIAKVNTPDGTFLVSFMGLGKGKTWQDVHNKVWSYKLGDQAWQAKSPVPSSLPLKGRLAAIAVGLNGKAWLFGGYTVAEDHSEISSPDNFAYNVLADTYHPISAMPVPVDDAVALVYQNRYIYLISGWHNDGNVNLTQVYDTQTDTWSQASPFLGQPVFGHSGGIVGNRILVCDGVKVIPRANKRRTFGAETACYLGTIDQQNIHKIDWRTLPHPTKTARYRMAARGVVFQPTAISKNNADKPSESGVIFIGGSNNPYNYDGIGYNQKPSHPDPQIWYFSFNRQQWTLLDNAIATMDHRGLIEINNDLAVIGGMGKEQKVLNTVFHFNKSKLLTSIIEN